MTGAADQMVEAIRDEGSDPGLIDEFPIVALFPFEDEYRAGDPGQKRPGIVMNASHEERRFTERTACESKASAIPEHAVPDVQFHYLFIPTLK